MDLMPGLISIIVVSAVAFAVGTTYYLWPSRGQHSNPRGAVVTVDSLCAQDRWTPSSPPANTAFEQHYGLLCGYEVVPERSATRRPSDRVVSGNGIRRGQ